MPSELPRPEPPRRGPRILGLLAAALIALVTLGAGLALAAISMPWLIGGMSLIVGVFSLAAVHYVVWGWWLGPRIRRDHEAQRIVAAERADRQTGE